MIQRSKSSPFYGLPWYWATAHDESGAKERFVIANGQDVMWRRVHHEIDPSEDCAWMPFGSEPTLSDCFRVFINAREVYGVDLNRAMCELAQVPVFAEFVAEKNGIDIHQLISNPIQGEGHPLRRPKHDNSAAAKLGAVVAQTLGLPSQWWEQ